MKQILVGAAACGCLEGPSGAGKTEIPAKALSRHVHEFLKLPIVHPRHPSALAAARTGAAYTCSLSSFPTGSPILHADAHQDVPEGPHPTVPRINGETLHDAAHGVLSTEPAKRSSIDLSALIAPSPYFVVLAYVLRTARSVPMP